MTTNTCLIHERPAKGRKKKKRRFEGQSTIVAQKREKEWAWFMPVVTEPRERRALGVDAPRRHVRGWEQSAGRQRRLHGAQISHTHTKPRFQIPISHAWRKIANRMRKCTSSIQKGGKLKSYFSIWQAPHPTQSELPSPDVWDQGDGLNMEPRPSAICPILHFNSCQTCWINVSGDKNRPSRRRRGQNCAQVLLHALAGMMMNNLNPPVLGNLCSWHARTDAWQKSLAALGKKNPTKNSESWGDGIRRSPLIAWDLHNSWERARRRRGHSQHGGCYFFFFKCNLLQITDYLIETVICDIISHIIHTRHCNLIKGPFKVDGIRN